MNALASSSLTWSRCCLKAMPPMPTAVGAVMWSRSRIAMPVIWLAMPLGEIDGQALRDRARCSRVQRDENAAQHLLSSWCGGCTRRCAAPPSRRAAGSAIVQRGPGTTKPSSSMIQPSGRPVLGLAAAARRLDFSARRHPPPRHCRLLLVRACRRPGPVVLSGRRRRRGSCRRARQPRERPAAVRGATGSALALAAASRGSSRRPRLVDREQPPRPLRRLGRRLGIRRRGAGRSSWAPRPRAPPRLGSAARSARRGCSPLAASGDSAGALGQSGRTAGSAAPRALGRRQRQAPSP